MVASADMSSTRLQSLDVLRGIAILGTLGTNIWIFTDPEG
ncbi:Predicted membrane protein [Mycolicibacterium fortuitum]|uniref:Predicted membrane protein n=1 Tax=Mycolicibacterium fortuitum TaxID=1766 RepID=A0A378UBD0_MYCFO|nr:Predicted membrane protein [Mycolicibacterium fortuitum]